MSRPAVSKHLVWLITAALVAQSWLSQLATAAVDADVDAIVICTGSGFKIVSLPDDMHPPSDRDGNSQEHGERPLDCAACLVHAVGKTVGESAFDATPIIWPAVVFDVTFATQPLASPTPCAHRSRAPPAG